METNRKFVRSFEDGEVKVDLYLLPRKDGSGEFAVIEPSNGTFTFEADGESKEGKGRSFLVGRETKTLLGLIGKALAWDQGRRAEAKYGSKDGAEVDELELVGAA